MKKNEQRQAPTQEEVNDYFNYSASTGGMICVSNASLVCRDCKYRLESVDRCNKYDMKPGKVIYCKPCEKYEKESFTKKPPLNR